MPIRLRRSLVSLHIWLGITIGALWALQGLTGAILVFNRDVQSVQLGAAPGSSGMLPLDEIFSRASNAAGARVEMLETFTPQPTLLLAYYKEGTDENKQLVVDARRGTILDHRYPETKMPTGGSTWSWLLHLHESLLRGDNGLYLVGTSGLLLFSSVVMGLAIGWPRRGQWRHAYRPGRWRTGSQKLFGWHRMLGLTLGAVALLSATSGSYLAFAPELRPMLGSAGLYKMPYKPHPVEQIPPPAITVQQAFAIAQARFPGAGMVRATLPTKKAPVYGFRLLQAGEWRRWAGTTTIFIDPANGNVLSAYDPLSAPFFNILNDNLYPTHTGEAGGLLLRTLIFLAGLSLPVMYVTGLWAWVRRRRRRGKPVAGPVLGAAKKGWRKRRRRGPESLGRMAQP